MTYEQALQRIHSLLTFGSRPGLDRMRELLKRMGDPQDRLRYIHVAGTNGKGSVCAMLSAVLKAAGYKTGLFISPYITDFRERIQIDNVMISEDTLAEAVEQTFPLIEQLRSEGIIITEFEYVNALEFYIHANAGCDVVVLETGMGGLLDCTNVIKPPLCAVITVIGLDHTAILGDTVEKISAQKCGIIKSGSRAVTSAQCDEAMAVIEKTAAERAVPLRKAEDIRIETLGSDLRGSRFVYGGQELFLLLAGGHQLDNARTALAAIETLNESGALTVNMEAVAEGMARAVNPARLELLGEEPVVLLDGAHNPNGIEALQRAIKEYLDSRELICVMGMLADKDVDSSISLLSGLFREIIAVPVNNPRALGAEALAEKCRAQGIKARSFGSAEEGFDEAYAAAREIGGAVLVCGSLYLAGELRPYIISFLQQA